MSLLRLHLLLVLFFLWAPLLLLVAFSFDAALSLQHWTPFTAQHYVELWESEVVRQAALNSVLVAVPAAAIATLLGTLFALGLAARRPPSRARLLTLALLPALVPEVLVAAGLLTTYALAGLAPGLASIVPGHALLALGFAALAVLRRLPLGDRQVQEASANLGAGAFTTFRRVTLPLILPGVLAALLLSLALSLGEFVLALLVAGDAPSAATLPVLTRVMFRTAALPWGSALTAALLLASFLLILLALRLSRPPRPPRVD